MNTSFSIKMEKIKGYNIKDLFHHGRGSLLYKGTRSSDNQAVIIKVPAKNFLNNKDIQVINQEFKIGNQFHDKNIIEYYAIERSGSIVVQILEDFGAQSLEDLINKKGITILEFLPIAIQLAGALSVIHDQGIVHRDIQPANIVINLETGLVKIIDFGMASKIILDDKTESIEGLKGNLLFISPEQTGRLNRKIDHRTDFFSLGVTLYLMLTGHYPFESNDPLEMIHSKIAKLPMAVKFYRPDVPEVISDIIMKLIEKNAEDRYQSGTGLRMDLERCLKEYRENKSIASFELALHDSFSKLIISGRIYGREKEIQVFNETLANVIKGNLEILFVSGHSGIGKTTLVNEIQSSVIENQGYFITGKFSQIHKNVAYSGILHAFQSLVRQILSESEQRVLVWKENLLSHLGANGQVLIKVLPELEHIIGRQKPVSELTPVESQNRFNTAFQLFVSVFAETKHPMVLFLDDLQWIDPASLNLLKLLCKAGLKSTLLIIGAYRDNEVPTGHPLLLMIKELTDEGLAVREMKIPPLDFFSANDWLSDTFRLPIDKTNPLTELLYDRTEGNPFFIKTLLQSLYDNSLLTYDRESSWHWDIDRIRQEKVSDNLVEIMIIKIKLLPEVVQDILKLASCIGIKFYLSDLSIILGQAKEEIASILHAAIIAGIITKGQDEYRFAHDRIEEAANSMVSEKEQKEFHWMIGQKFLECLNPPEVEEKIFEIVNQLNLGAPLKLSEEERERMAKLNLRAGLKAKSTTAFESARLFFKNGIDYLSKDSWQESYQLSLQLHLEYGEACYLSQVDTDLIKILSTVMEKARGPLDKVKIYEIKIVELAAANRMREAFDLGKEALTALGVKLPKKGSNFTLLKEILKLRFYLRGKKIEDLLSLSPLKDKKKLAIARLFMECVEPCYVVEPKYLPVIILRLLVLSLKFGNSAYSAYAYASYGLILSMVLGDIRGGEKFGRLALELVAKLDGQLIKSKVFFIFGSMINHWSSHIKEDLRYLLEAAKSGYETGDFTYASFGINHFIFNSFFMGENLDRIKKKQEKYLNRMRGFPLPSSTLLFDLWLQFVDKLKNGSGEDLEIEGEYFSEKEVIPRWQESGHLTNLGNFTVCKMILAFLVGNNKECIRFAQEGKKYLESMIGMFYVPEYYFYYTLSLLAEIESPKLPLGRKYLKLVNKNQRKIRDWSASARENFEHKYLLIEAEKSRIIGNNRKAIEFYDRAISLAQKNRFQQDEAIANELAAKFWLRNGNNKIAKVYINESYYAYSRWNCNLKVRYLDKKYLDLIMEASRIEDHRDSFQGLSSSVVFNSLNSDGTDFLDLLTVAKASRAISSEINLSKLLTKIMKIILENLGAQKGILVLSAMGKLKIEARALADSDNVEVLNSVPIEDSRELSEGIVHYVSRTGENVIINDISHENLFMHDPYIVQYRPKSILCTPIFYQDKIQGVLYLENSSTAYTFTKDRVGVLYLLLSQAAISLENARLFSDTVSLNEKLRKEVNERKRAELKTKKINRELGKKVEERTRVLKESNEALRDSLESLKKTQEQLVQSEKMAALGELVAGVSHEINTPLGIGVTAASYLELETQNFSKLYREELITRADFEDYIESALEISASILSNLKRAADLVKSFKQVSVDQVSEVSREFNLKEYINEILNSLSPKFKRAKHTILFTCPENLEIESNPGAFSQIITNLTMNSLIHGFADIKEGKIEIAVKEEDGELILEYRDNGVGMEDEILKKIYDPFFTTKRLQKRTGLGMHIVFNLVTQTLKGNIECKSALNQGVLFMIRIPPNPGE